MTSLLRSMVLVVVLLAAGASPSQAQRSAVSDRPEVSALRVLHQWEADRASAYAGGDVRGLRVLYSPASRAGARDADVLREYAGRGLVVRGLASQVLSVQVLDRGKGRLKLEVVERFAGATVRAGGSRRLLPTGAVTTRVVTMVRPGQDWLVRSIRRG